MYLSLLKRILIQFKHLLHKCCLHPVLLVFLYLIFIVVVQNGLSFEITLSNYLLMVYRNIIDFNVLIL